LTNLAQIERVLYFQDVPLFAHCSAAQVLRIAAIAEERRFATGEAVYAVNDPSDAIYCVVEGNVNLDNPSSSEAAVGAGGAFGVIDILSGGVRTANAVAETDTITLAIDADDFFDLLSHNVDIVKAIFRSLSERVKTPLAW